MMNLINKPIRVMVFALLLGVSGLIEAEGAGETEGAGEAQGAGKAIVKGEADPNAVDLFKSPKGYDKEIDGYRRAWTHVSAIDFSGLHWNHFVTIYMNKNAQVYRNNFREYLIFQQMDEEEEEYDPSYQTYDPGTIFIKEHYVSAGGRPGDAAFISTMIKREKGYDSDYGDWEYIHSDAQGNIIFQGNSSGDAVMKACVDCHANMAARDYIFALNYKELLNQP